MHAGLQLYTQEVFPTKVRGVGGGLLNTVSRVACLVAPVSAGAMLDHAGVDTLLLLCCFVVASVPVAAICLPMETRGRHILGDGCTE